MGKRLLYLIDLRGFLSSTRRIIRHNPFWSLTPPQKENMYNTCQEAIDATERVKRLCNGGEK